MAGLAVNRVRCIERNHGEAYSALFRAAVALWYALRAYNAVHRHCFAVLLNRRRWKELPQATKNSPSGVISGSRQRGAVIIPAYNEANVIKRTLAPLSRAGVDGYIEVIVVCNGCIDDTAEIARSVPGVRVLELKQASKPTALNAGDDAATLWPRLYLDADVQISAETVLAVLDRLAQGDVLVARPSCRYDTRSASAIVRSFYRARDRIPQRKSAMSGAGVYGLSKTGHERFDTFPMIVCDDLYVDSLFNLDEKDVVFTDPVVVTTPYDAKNLLAIMRRNHRGNVELLADKLGAGARVRHTSVETAVTVVCSIRGPRSAVDAAVFLGMSLAKRRDSNPHRWERDESSRLNP